jgi:hypothetical protein
MHPLFVERRLVRDVLQHLGNEDEQAASVLRDVESSVQKAGGGWRCNGRAYKAQEEETAHSARPKVAEFPAHDAAHIATDDLKSGWKLRLA